MGTFDIHGNFAQLVYFSFSIYVLTIIVGRVRVFDDDDDDNRGNDNT